MLLRGLALLVSGCVERSEKAVSVGSQKIVMGTQNRSLSRREDLEMGGWGAGKEYAVVDTTLFQVERKLLT